MALKETPEVRTNLAISASVCSNAALDTKSETDDCFVLFMLGPFVFRATSSSTSSGNTL